MVVKIKSIFWTSVLAIVIFIIASSLVGFSSFHLPNTNRTGITLNEVKEVTKLASVEFIMDARGKHESALGYKGYNVPGTQKRYLAIGQGTVVAGIDMDKITMFEYTTDGTVTLKLPNAEILYKSINPNSWEVWDESDGIFVKLSASQIHEITALAEEDMVNRAVENGIIEKADERTKQTIEKMLLTAGAKKVVFL